MDLSPGNDSLYTTLDTCRDEVRLLEITSVEPVVCKLSIVSLLDEPEFSALSYTWGDASNNQHIIVGNKAMTIRMNLFDFLYAFRSDDANIRHLWIDQVCSMAPL